MVRNENVSEAAGTARLTAIFVCCNGKRRTFSAGDTATNMSLDKLSDHALSPRPDSAKLFIMIKERLLKGERPQTMTVFFNK